MNNPSITYLLTRRDKAQLFLYAYYSYPGWGWLRSFGGPAVAVAGAFIVSASEGWMKAVGGFFIGYGIYYAIKPVLHFLLTRKKQIDTREKVEYDVEEGVIHFSSNQVRLDIPGTDLLAVKKTPFGKSLLIRVQGRLSRIFIPQPRVVEGDYEAFIAAMESLAQSNRGK